MNSPKKANRLRARQPLAEKRRKLSCERLESRSMLHAVPFNSDLFFALALGEQPVAMAYDVVTDRNETFDHDAPRRERKPLELVQEPEGEPGSENVHKLPGGRDATREPIGNANGQHSPQGRFPGGSLPLGSHSNSGLTNNTVNSVDINTQGLNTQGLNTQGLNTQGLNTQGLNATRSIPVSNPVGNHPPGLIPPGLIPPGIFRNLPELTTGNDAAITSRLRVTANSAPMISSLATVASNPSNAFSQNSNHSKFSSLPASANHDDARSLRSDSTAVIESSKIDDLDRVAGEHRADRAQLIANLRSRIQGQDKGQDNSHVNQAALDKSTDLPTGGDGLLELTTDRQRIFPESDLAPYSADASFAANEREQYFGTMGLYREFDLAIPDSLLEAIPVLNADGPLRAADAVDAWFQAHGTSGPRTANEITQDVLDSTANTTLRQLALPMSFLAITGLMISSRRRYYRQRTTDDCELSSDVT